MRSERAVRALRDPRHYQIAVLSLLLCYGIAELDLEVRGDRSAAVLAAALLTQLACSRIWRLPRFDPRSALISGLSLCLLLRTASVGLAAAAAGLTVASKFLIRWRGKHVFNPSNFGLVAMMALTDRVWVSSGQWGSAALFGLLLGCLGGLVVHRAARSDVTWAFLGSYAAFLFGRAWWLGDPLAIPAHQLQNGALLIFAFFMISDPKTTPDSRRGRVLFAALVALGAAFVGFRLYEPNGMLWSLAALAPAVPMIDRWLPAARYEWGAPGGAPAPQARCPAPASLPGGLPAERRIS